MSLNSTNKFSVSNLRLEEYTNYALLMDQWAGTPGHPDSKLVCEHMANALKTPKEDVFTEAFACKDLGGEIRSVALIKFAQLHSRTSKNAKEYLKLTYIATSPQHTRRGAGKFLMNHLMSLSLSQNTQGIYLNSVESAKTFYEKKMSFKPLTAPLEPYDVKHDGPFPMLLSAEKISKLVKT